MKIAEYKKNFSGPFKEMTLGYLLRDDEVLLAMKKRGFGVGKWNGTGGKLHPGETFEEGLLREAQEELEITPVSFQKTADIKFYFPHDPSINEICKVYLIDRWEGEPKETEEMAPQWFKVKETPYFSMWESDQLWLPQVLAGHVLEAEFLFGEEEEVLDFDIA